MLLSPREVALPALSRVHLMSHTFLFPATDALTPGGKGPTKLCASHGIPPSSAPLAARGSRLSLPWDAVRDLRCSTWDAMLICIYGEVWESPSGSDNGLNAVPCALGRKLWQSLPQCLSQPLWRHSLGQKSLAQPANKTASRLFVDQCSPSHTDVCWRTKTSCLPPSPHTASVTLAIEL